MSKIKRNSQCFFNIETEKQICADYINAEGGATYLKNKYGANSVSTIYSVLKAYNIPRRNLSEARRIASGYSIDETCFTDYDDAETCYWLGVMYTDGYISKTGNYTNFLVLAYKKVIKNGLKNLKSI